MALVKQAGLENEFRFLGLVPYEHVMPLARAALALINPSLFEGWSTTVEEAKALGVPMLLTEISLHREQAQVLDRFFDPHRADDVAACLADAWQPLPDAELRLGAEEQALEAYGAKRQRFAADFADTVAKLAK